MNIAFQIISTAFALFLLMDPIGNVPLFISLLKHYPPKKQRKIIYRELLIALGVILFFNFLGDWILNLIQVEQYTILIAGGIILFIISLRMIFSSDAPSKEKIHQSPHKEPFIVPLAIPLVAGPAVLAAVMLYAKQEEYVWITVSAVFLAWLCTTCILLSSTFLQKILGDTGLAACEKLMGLLLTLIAIQMFLEGIHLSICTLQTVSL